MCAHCSAENVFFRVHKEAYAMMDHVVEEEGDRVEIDVNVSILFVLK
jgi:hypothetical protein